MNTPASTPARPPAAVTLPVQGMTCASCVGRVERALKKLPGVASVQVNLATESATLRFDGPPDVAAAIATIEKSGYAVPQASIELQVQGMTCASCVGRVERVLRRVPGVQEVAVNLATERARIKLLAGTPVQALVAAVMMAGYEAVPVVQEASAQASDAQAERQAAERQRLQRSLWLALVLALPVFILEMGGHLFPPLHTWIDATIGMRNSWLLQCALTSAVLLGPGRQFYRLGVPASSWMRARSVARFTATSCTPGTRRSVRSTRPTHEAQVMPCTCRVTAAAAVGAVTALAAVFMAVVPSVMRGL